MIYTGKMLWSSNWSMISVRELNLVGIYGSNLLVKIDDSLYFLE